MKTEKNIRWEELASKMTRLEETIQQQKFLIKEFQNERQSSISSELIASKLEINGQVRKSVSFPRTCRELRAADPSLHSGMHWIDPERQGVGDDPIYIYCNMTTGIIKLRHGMPTYFGRIDWNKFRQDRKDRKRFLLGWGMDVQVNIKWIWNGYPLNVPYGMRNGCGLGQNSCLKAIMCIYI